MSSPGPNPLTILTVLNALPDPVVAVAQDGDMVYVSPHAAELIKTQPRLSFALKAMGTQVIQRGAGLTDTVSDGAGKRWECRVRPAEDGDARLAVIWLREERLDLMAELDAVRDDNRILVQEVHHRVKNSLQVVSAMLRMQAWRSADADLRRPFEDACNRIMTLATVHEVLYRQGSPSSVDFSIVLENLVAELMRQRDPGRPSLDVALNGATVMLSLEQAIPAALIIQEWLNAAEGAVAIDIHEPGKVVFSGQPRLDPGSLGGRMVAVLVAQLHGRIERHDGPPELNILHLKGDNLGTMAGSGQEPAEILV